MSQTRLFVGNLPNDAQDSDLRSAFSNYGEVVNLDIKSKSNLENDPKKFAFVTISGGNDKVETCIKYFSSNDFNGSRLYVTRARESFLERLQREREQAEKKIENSDQIEVLMKHPVIKLGDKLNPKKRKIDVTQSHQPERNLKVKKIFERNPTPEKPHTASQSEQNVSTTDKKKQEADKKRMESMQKKRQEFKNKQKIIKTGLIGIDKVVNKKTKFSDDEEVSIETLMKPPDSECKPGRQNKLFDDDDDESDDEVNFEIKKQYEGKKGKKVLDLQSRYKSDKRFVLDERFIEDDHAENETDKEKEDEPADEDPSDQIEMSQGDEKTKQFKILEDVLGVAIKSHVNKPEKGKLKPNMGMIRFDPMNPEHAKFVVPIEEIKQESKKAKKNKKQLSEPTQPTTEASKVKVSKEQFYKSEITKEAFLQPATGFSLRSLFANDAEDLSKDQKQEDNYTQVQPQKQQKVKNPLDPGEKNPFVYDSSESEDEEDATKGQQAQSAPEAAEVKAVWRENLFFSKDDSRLTDGLAFFNNIPSRETPKERRELKSVMMKRIHNTERKNQMFKKKIGGRKKSMKKSYKKKT